MQKLKLSTELAHARIEAELQGRRAEIEKARVATDEILSRSALEAARLQESAQAEMAALRLARERASLEAAVAEAKFQQQSNTAKVQEIVRSTHLAELNARISEHEKEAQADGYVDSPAAYLRDPVQADGSLVITDRRIPLNGLITLESADAVCARIEYFNNKSREYPIFIVIDQSPGGSVMAGYKILKTMQSSSAPIYVVVKSFAASMAAAICTLAPHSYAYPNAIILHHQISNGYRGNLANQRENVKMLEESWRRLATPIAAKMGITIDEFTRQMYVHCASGDWQEFADEAKKLHWVDGVIGTCRETALVRNPDASPAAGGAVASTAGAPVVPPATEGSVHNAAALPHLNPIDCYYLYNPDGYYRLE